MTGAHTHDLETRVALDAPQHAALSKLAQVPDGARAFAGSGGGAPAVSLDLDGGLDAEGGAVGRAGRRYSVVGARPASGG